jgi:site-specific DNA-methyltransferase (adenine-specific)
MTGIVREVTIGDCRLIQGDCLEVMPGLGPVDCALTDPPYGTTACKWDSVIPFAPMWGQLKRIVKPNGAIVLTASQPFTSALVMSNAKMFKYCWVWDKKAAGNHGLAKYQPMKVHEDVVVFSQKTHLYLPIMTEGNPRKKVSSSSNNSIATGMKQVGPRFYSNYYPKSILEITNAGRRGKAHPTQKPVALMEYLIRTYTNPGEVVLDFTMGSGTTGVAAANTGRRFIGIERDPGYFDVAVKRTREAVELASAQVQGGMGF